LEGVSTLFAGEWSLSRAVCGIQRRFPGAEVHNVVTIHRGSCRAWVLAPSRRTELHRTCPAIGCEGGFGGFCGCGWGTVLRIVVRGRGLAVCGDRWRLLGASGRTTRYRMGRCTGCSARWCAWSTRWFGRLSIGSGWVIRWGLGQVVGTSDTLLLVRGPHFLFKVPTSRPANHPALPANHPGGGPDGIPVICGRTSQRLRA